MRIQIARIEGNIITSRDYSNIEGSGEIAHFIAEIETIKLELIELWKEYNETIT